MTFIGENSPFIERHLHINKIYTYFAQDLNTEI